MIKLSKIFLIPFLLILVSSCDQERSPCLEPRTTSVRVGCYTVKDTTITDSLLPNVNFAGLDNDTLKFLYLGEDHRSKFSILLSSLTDSCIWLLQPDSAVSPMDTIQFYYHRELRFLSNACGYTYFFSLKNIVSTKHNIDSIKITNNEVSSNANSGEHVQIFF